MQQVQLYIGDNRVELFDDETITITQTLKNAKDVDKIFTDFTQSFTVPASKNNNKIFEHYYNSDIVDGFDARKKVTAHIELNHILFKKGKIKLDGVNLKNNKAHAYRITFFGNSIQLKDIIGEDKLNDLDLSTYNTQYKATSIESGLTLDPTSNDLIVPLITHTQRLYFDSSQSTAVGTEIDNIEFAGTNVHRGVRWNQLKYALRVSKIIDAIESDYLTPNGLSFSNDFFNSSNSRYDDLFMWLHRKSGFVENLEDETQIQVTGFSTGGDILVNMTGTFLGMSVNPSNISTFSLTITSSDSDQYAVLIRNGGTVVFRSDFVSGSQTFSAPSNFSYATGSYDVFIVPLNLPVTISKIRWTITHTQDGGGSFTFDSNNVTFEPDFAFVISQQIPEMKIMDFLNAIWKMFNLVAFIDENNIVQVDTLDNFYSGATSYDISEFVDVEESQVDVPLAYKEIKFAYKDTGTILATKFNQIVNKEWGAIFFNSGEESLTGGLYTVEIPFHHMQFERLKDDFTQNNTNIMYGLFTDNNLNSYHKLPLIFYANQITGISYSFVDDVERDNEPNSAKEKTIANLPSNSRVLEPSTSTDSIHFTSELSEWVTTATLTNSLFETYHKSYISDIFSQLNRLTKVTAYLPLRIIRELTLDNRVIINGKTYKINSIKTNLQTGKSDLELLNEL
jgi:hypothetical protein